MIYNNITKQGELLPNLDENNTKRIPIQLALTWSLEEAVGKSFLPLSGTTEEVQDLSDEIKTISWVYGVWVISYKF